MMMTVKQTLMSECRCLCWRMSALKFYLIVVGGRGYRIVVGGQGYRIMVGGRGNRNVVGGGGIDQ